VLGRILPARWAGQQPAKEFEPIADLDAIISRPKAFKLFGRWRQIKPLTTEEFLRYINAVNRVMQLDSEASSSGPEAAEKALDACFEVFASVCDDITREEVGRMALVQATNLFGLITESVTGKLSEDEKKNLLKTQRAPESA